MTTTRRKKTGRRLSNMEFDEVSVVTNPANQHAKIVLWKAADGPPTMSERNRDVLAKKFGVDIARLPADVQAALAELVDDNVELAKTATREKKRNKALSAALDELDEHELSRVGCTVLDQQGWGRDDILDNKALPVETVVAKMGQFGEGAFLLEDDVMDEIERRADALLAKGNDSLTRAQAIAKVVSDNPDFLKAYRAVQIAKAEAARGFDMQYLQDTIEDQQAALSLIHAEADTMVRDGLAPTREQATVQLLRQEPELWRAWNESFRQP
jgi:hypothetical protein